MPCPGSWEGNSELALLFALNRSSRASRFKFAGSGPSVLSQGSILRVTTIAQRSSESCGTWATSSVPRADSVTPSNRTPS